MDVTAVCSIAWMSVLYVRTCMKQTITVKIYGICSNAFMDMHEFIDIP